MLTSLLAALRGQGLKLGAQSERRIHNRALSYWQKMRQDQEFPLLVSFEFLEKEGLADHGFLLDLRSATEPTFASVGEILCEEAQLTCPPLNLTEAAPASLLRRFAEKWSMVTASKAPFVSEYEFETEAGYHVSCRGVLLPLSLTGRDLDFVLGVVSWKSEISRAGAQSEESKHCHRAPK